MEDSIVALNYRNLDSETRKFMVEEVEMDMACGTLYLSPWLTDRGRQDWPEMIHDAVISGNDFTLSTEIPKYNRLARTAKRRKPTGGFTNYLIPHTAPETMAEGEFNRFYVRGLCRRALNEGLSYLTIYRAKQVLNPRPDSQAKIGSRVDPALILADLRLNQGIEPALGLPSGPNSGLSAQLS
jgi:hypothetical protein